MKQTMENYTRQMDEQPIHASYRYDIEFQEEAQGFSWTTHTRGKWQAVDPGAEYVLLEVVELQKARPDRSFRIIRRVERETRSEPFHPAWIRQIAESK